MVKCLTSEVLSQWGAVTAKSPYSYEANMAVQHMKECNSPGKVCDSICAGEQQCAKEILGRGGNNVSIKCFCWNKYCVVLYFVLTTHISKWNQPKLPLLLFSHPCDMAIASSIIFIWITAFSLWFLYICRLSTEVGQLWDSWKPCVPWDTRAQR